MMLKVQDIRNEFIRKKREGEIVDLNGTKVIEIIGASFEADEPMIFGELNDDYIQAEIAWYQSQSRSVHDLKKHFGKVPKIWEQVSSSDGLINSNYGLLIYSKLYGSQYDNVYNELVKNPHSRRAVMVYNRPSIWNEFDHNGMSDFICTNAVSYQIRDNKLHVVVQMRSNDAWAGYRNDLAWAKHVQHRLATDLLLWEQPRFDELELGSIIWQVQNLHFYERNFGLIPE